MLQTCKFKRGRDIVETNPDLAFDFKGSVRNGIVVDSSAKVFHNKIENGEDVGPRITDKFDVIHYDNALRAYRKYHKEKSEKKDGE